MASKDKLLIRLQELSGDELIELLELAVLEYPALRKEFMNRTAGAKELSASIKRGITSLQKLDAGGRVLDAKKIATKIEDIITLIDRLGHRQPNESFAMICTLLSTELHVHEEVDDDHGLITDTFRTPLIKCAAALVGRCYDEKVLLTSMRMACAHDPFGTVLMFIDAVGHSLPESIIEELYADANMPVAIRKHLLLAIGDVDRYTELCKASDGLTGSDMLNVADMLVEHDELEGAEQQLNKITDASVKVTQKYRTLQMRILKGLGRTAKIAALLRQDVLEHPCHPTLDAYRATCGDKAADGVVKELLAKASTPSAMELMIDLGYGDQMIDRVTAMRRVGYIDFAEFISLAKAFQSKGLLLGASLILRLLIEDILDNGRSDAYHFAASYVVNLQTWSQHITNWRGHPNHREFYDQIHRKHERKSAFWAAVRRGW